MEGGYCSALGIRPISHYVQVLAPVHTLFCLPIKTISPLFLSLSSGHVVPSPPATMPEEVGCHVGGYEKGNSFLINVLE